MKSELSSNSRSFSRRDFLRLSALTAGGLLVARCAPTAPATTVAPTSAATEGAVADGITRGGRFVLGTPQPIQTLDPHAFGIFNNRNAWAGLWNGLFRYDADMVPQPDLAKSWEVSDDGLTYTFELQDNVLFHNGRAMTAEDVKFSIERVLNPDTKSANYGAAISAVDTVTATGDHTVEVKLKSPSATLIPGLARVMIVAQENVADIASAAIGTGPYKLNEYVVGEQLVFDRFDDYWAGTPNMDGVTIRTRTDPTALFTDLTTGAVDAYWQLEPKFVGQLARYETLEASFARSSNVVTFVAFDNMGEPFKDIRARQALLYAFDKPTMNQLAFFGTGVIPNGNNIFPKGHPYENTGLADITYDLEKAKALFDEAGVTELRWVALSIVPWTLVIAQVLERSLNEIGIKLTIENPELAGWNAAMDPVVQPNTVVPNTLPNSDPDFTLTMTDNAVNRWGFDNAEMEDLRAQGAAELDEGKRKEIYNQIQQIWHDEIPAIIVCHDRWFHGKNKRVQNFVHINAGDIDYHDAWLSA